jgi:general stress protein YciG
MDKQRQREIASRGGRAAHEKGTAHEFSSQEATLAAKKGHEQGTAHEFTPEEARVAGRKGGLARAQNRTKGPEQSPADQSGEASDTHMVAPEPDMVSAGSQMEYSN